MGLQSGEHIETPMRRLPYPPMGPQDIAFRIQCLCTTVQMTKGISLHTSGFLELFKRQGSDYRPTPCGIHRIRPLIIV